MSASAHKWSYVFDRPTRILVVDDDPILQEFAAVHLSAPLSKVDSARDALDALDLLTRNEYDIALVDIEMPGMDGFELVQRIRAQEKLRNLPIVIITGRDDIASIDRAYTAGATSFATKPINWRQLSYQLRYVMRAIDRDLGKSHVSSEEHMAAHQAMPDALQHVLTIALNSIVDTAALIAAGHVPIREAEHAQEIINVAESMLRMFLAAGNSLKTGNSCHATQLDQTQAR